jgi:16S rRNA (uracil1498-N3)-methyltransferase
MSLRTRIYLTTEELAPQLLQTLNEQQTYYLANVLRAKVGEKIRVFNGKNGEWEASIVELNKKHITIILIAQLKMQDTENKLHLAFSPIKNVHTSFIIQKATELGVTDIWPVICKRTIVDKVNYEKLLLTAIEAAEQSERLAIPKINPIQKLSHFIQHKSFAGNLIFCYEKEPYKNINEILLPLNHHDNCILIGPEGGFSSDEADLIKKFNYTVPVNFGKRIMKAETALIAAISSYNTILSNWI